MKRVSSSLAAALVIGSAVVPIEAVEPACKDRESVDELPAKVPDPPHTHQEAVENHEATDMVVIPRSPILTVPRNSPAHKEWIKRYGTQGERDIERYNEIVSAEPVLYALQVLLADRSESVLSTPSEVLPFSMQSALN